ncbi:MAG: hypothetical protein DMG12_12600, partial [Acidobacteria bacterium]
MRAWLFRFWLGFSILSTSLAGRGQEGGAPEKPKSAEESRRNENVQFNLIDNNALKELNVRLGSSATVTPAFQPEFRYFGTEFGNKPSGPMHLSPVSSSRDFHGGISFTHSNSIFSARSFFQVGSVKPAHENNYGFVAGVGLWRGAHLTLDGSGQKLRGSVNGNVLVPLASERVPLTTDAGAYHLIQRWIDAYPKLAPNRNDVDPRMLNTNSPQSINTDASTIRLDQDLGGRDRLFLRHAFTNQQVQAFEFVAGQNPDTNTKSHNARLTWNHFFDPRSFIDFTTGFDRVHSLLVPEPNAVGPQVIIGTSYTAGAEWVRDQNNGREASSDRGNYYFRADFGRDAITNFRLGIPSRYSVGIGEGYRGFRWWEQQYFAGDIWKVRSNLTTNFGLRYQPITGPSEVNHLTEINFDCNCKALAPQFGFAWQLPRAGVIRAAYGLQFGDIYYQTLQQVRWDPPGFLKVEVQAPPLLNPLVNTYLGPGARHTQFEVPSNLKAPYTHEYNFSWDPLAGRPWNIQLSYIGSRTHKLFMMWFT